MKSIATLLSLLALAASGAIATAQTNTTATDSTLPAVAATAPASTTDAPVIVAAAPVAQPDAAALSTNAATAGAPAPEAAASTNAVLANAPAGGETHDPHAIIPLIVMDEVPLTDAIKNLARQAGLNYMLDPKINYGAPDASGVVHQAPTISLRWENLTADQALNAVLTTYNLTIVEDPKTHIALISIKDPAAPDPLVTKIIQLKYTSSSNMVEKTTGVLTDKRSKVIGDNRTSQMVVVATEKEIAGINELVARLDTPTKQVLIEARLVELSKNPTTAKGVDWSQTLAAQNVRFGNNVLGGQGNRYSATLSSNVAGGFTTTYGPNNLIPSAGVAPGLLVDTARGLNPATAFLDADGLSAVFSFLNTDANAKVLSTPRAVTLDNEEAILSVTEAQPIIQTTAGTQGSPGGAQVTYTNLGTTLKVTPRISANNTVNLTVEPELSEFEKTITKIDSGLRTDADVFAIRRIVTHVVIPSGNTLVMGGLVSDSSNTGNSKVPILGDIPGLGWAFRSETKSQNKKNLLIFVTPTIVQDADFQPTETTFLKSKMPDLQNADFGAWDSGTPQDWSKLAHSKKDVAASTATDSGPVWPTDK